jgi:hypothetical protein
MGVTIVKRIKGIELFKSSKMEVQWNESFSNKSDYNLEINDKGKARIHCTAPFSVSPYSRFNQLSCIGKTSFYHYYLKVNGNEVYFKSNEQLH